MSRFYLMQLMESGTNWPEENRQHFWFALTVAQKEAGFDDTRCLLQNDVQPALEKIQKADQEAPDK
jgi:hypothetical protein